jgi:hypothetical protein
VQDVLNQIEISGRDRVEEIPGNRSHAVDQSLPGYVCDGALPGVRKIVYDPPQQGIRRRERADQRSVGPADVDRRPYVLGVEQPDDIGLHQFGGGLHRLGEERGLSGIGSVVVEKRSAERGDRLRLAGLHGLDEAAPWLPMAGAAQHDRRGSHRERLLVQQKFEHRRRGEVVVILDPNQSKRRCSAQQPP